MSGLYGLLRIVYAKFFLNDPLVGSEISPVFHIGVKETLPVKETRRCHILLIKCSMFLGLLLTDYVKLFLNDLLNSRNWFVIRIGSLLLLAFSNMTRNESFE